MTRVTSVRYALRDAIGGGMDGVWMYLPATGALSLETPCLLRVDDPDVECDPRGIPLAAIDQGFPDPGLDGATLHATAEWAQQFSKSPSDELLFESFRYYYRFDAFLPEPGAPDPPSREESQARQDREFLDSLGPEDPARPCKAPGCTRGAVRFSTLCGRHHFENVRGRPLSHGV